MKHKLIRLIGLTLALLSGSALAHDGAQVGGLLIGLLHPLSGIDHFLALLAVGIWSASLARKSATKTIATTFLLFMVTGAALGLSGFEFALLETAIALSVALSGLLLLSGAKPGLSIAATLAATFALFHGNAHALDVTTGASILSYCLGFLTASAMLLAAGAWIGARLMARAWSLRLIGMATGLVGGGLLLGT